MKLKFWPACYLLIAFLLGIIGVGNVFIANVIMGILLAVPITAALWFVSSVIYGAFLWITGQ